MLDLAGSRVLVLGLGISGRSAARFCADRGARVVAADEREAGSIGGLDTLPKSIELRVGAAFPDPAGFDLVVPSPGVPRERYAARAKRAWGDIELAYRAIEAPIVGPPAISASRRSSWWERRSISRCSRSRPSSSNRSSRSRRGSR
jgi:UDP-N-acetylmuramoylalanine--D-glutamate ligase